MYNVERIGYRFYGEHRFIFEHKVTLQRFQRRKSKLNKIVFVISNKKTKTNELLLIKYIKNAKLTMIDSHHHQLDAKFKISILNYSANR